MGECGCTMGNDAYRLPTGSADFLYMVELYPGCRNCVAPSGIIIKRIDRKHWYYKEAKLLPELPWMLFGEAKEATIKCGPDPDEFATAFCEQAKVGGFGKAVQESANDLADMVWDEAICAPEVIEPETKESRGRDS